MFTQRDGPTALRADLVRALSISVDIALVDGPDGRRECCAALGAVWNGQKGDVALLVREVARPRVTRYVATDPLPTLQALAAAIDEGIAVAESMGFTMDHTEFTSLGERQQRERLRLWDDIRKTKRSLRHLPEPPGAGTPAAAPGSGSPPGGTELVSREPDPFSTWDFQAVDLGGGGDPPGSDPEDLPAASGEAGRGAVLGRLALVRRGGRSGRRPSPLVRLLTYF